MMVPRKQGLIINISSIGGLQYTFNVCYGIGKVFICFVTIFGNFRYLKRDL